MACERPVTACRVYSGRSARVFDLLAGVALAWLPLAALAVTPQTTVQPSAAITYVVENGVPPVDAGMIDIFAGNFAPGGTLMADGSLLPIAPNQALFTQLGSTYGGNGASTFSLPDLNGRVPIGAGQGIGLTNRAIGSTTGVNQLTLTTAQLPTVVGGQNQAITNMQPSLSLTYLIAINGIFPSNGGSEDGAPLVGQVFLSASSNAVSNPPQGFLPAQGQILPIAQ
jgi:microcystin-dependent protein